VARSYASSYVVTGLYVHGDAWGRVYEYRRIRCERDCRVDHVGGSPGSQVSLEDTRAEVIAELVAAVNPLEIPSIAERVMRGERLPLEIIERIIDLTPLAELTSLVSLDLAGTKVTDLTPLAGLTVLQSLDLRGTPVTDLTPLAGVTGLKSLALSNTEVTDVTPPAGLTGLKSLVLSNTEVTDVTPLAGLTGLTISGKRRRTRR